jgi:hypothetical protein
VKIKCKKRLEWLSAGKAKDQNTAGAYEIQRSDVFESPDDRIFSGRSALWSNIFTTPHNFASREEIIVMTDEC